MTGDASLDALLDELADEIARQDDIHPAGFPATRDGVRFGICTAVDELDEAKDAWRAERKTSGWSETQTEMMQAAAVILRTLRSIRSS
jgi:hypothetical protein